jgi:hypothetical protein
VAIADKAKLKRAKPLFFHRLARFGPENVDFPVERGDLMLI